MKHPIYTIGHSTHLAETFVALLSRHGIDVLVDVRTSPFSRYNPQFNRESLKHLLRQRGIRYLFLGKELGARSDDPGCYVHNKVQYDLLAKTKLFGSGVDRVLEGSHSFRIALMCAEKDPLHCHRTILVSRELVRRGANVSHILPHGELEDHSEAMRRLTSELRLSRNDLFRSEQEIEEEAYAKQAERIAYDRSTNSESHSDIAAD